MVRCKHSNAEITVHQKTHYLIYINDGNIEPYGDAEPFETGEIGFHCRDCHTSRRYGNKSYCPKWLLNLIDEAEVVMGNNMR